MALTGTRETKSQSNTNPRASPPLFAIAGFLVVSRSSCRRKRNAAIPIPSSDPVDNQWLSNVSIVRTAKRLCRAVPLARQWVEAGRFSPHRAPDSLR